MSVEGDRAAMTRGERAEALFRQGYNCSQSVAVAYADLLQLPAEVVARLVSGFGGGMSRLREVCGAFSGVVFVLSALDGYGDPKDLEGKKALYARVQKLAEQYRAAAGSLICRDLLGLGAGKSAPAPEARTEEYYRKRPCAALCRLAAELLERELSEN
ncbi:MAG: C-GCAxxG-C-C family protein [Oscillospiraceae bacterium]|nr:C-GCAxxG-C-C family protein [Oscillospiraceae bacterium]